MRGSPPTTENRLSRLAREHAPDLILLDVMLPKLSGPDVLKALKKDPATASIPVMMLTSLSQKNAKQFEKRRSKLFLREVRFHAGERAGLAIRCGRPNAEKKSTPVNECNDDGAKKKGRV